MSLVKKFVVTGSSGQLGSTICKMFEEAGHETYGVDLKEGAYTRQTIDLLGVSKQEIAAIFQDLDCNGVINNAGAALFGDPLTRSWKESENLFKLNYFVPQLFMNVALSELRACRIINICSLYGHRVADQRIYVNSDRSSSEIYGSSKAALSFLTKYYASRYGSDAYQFNCVSPGGVWADIPGQSTEFRELYSQKVPLGRMAKAVEVASTVVWLATDAPCYINGQDLLVDGGYSVR